MSLRVFSEVAEFLSVVEATLLRNEAENSLLLGVMLRLLEGNPYGTEPPFLACVEDEGEVAAVAVRTPPHNLLIREEGDGLETLEFIARRLAEDGVRLPGVHAAPSSAASFARIWEHMTGAKSEIAMEQRLYRLTEVEPPVGVPGRFRLAEPADRDLLIEWVASFVDEAIGGAPHGRPDAMVDRRTEAGSLAVWDDGGPVSIASCGRPTPSGISISLVYTPPGRRGNGYAAACVAALSQRQLDAGRRYCTLFADLANRTSNALYRRVGYRPLADFLDIRFIDGSTAPSCPSEGADLDSLETGDRDGVRERPMLGARDRRRENETEGRWY